MTASTDKIKVIETIDDRVGGYNFLPTLIASRSRRKQCPLYLANPHGQTKSSFFGCAGSDRYSQDWSPSSMGTPQHKPNDSTRIGAGQSSFRGRVRCQSLFIAWERRRCEPGSNSVIVTASLTRCEGHVLRLGGVRRTRKIFVGCPAIRPIWDQSPGIRNPRFETVGNRLYPLHGQISLCRFAAEAQIQDRSRDKDRTKYRPGLFFIPAQAGTQRKTKHATSPLPRWERARVRVPAVIPANGNPEKNKARRLTSPLPRWEREGEANSRRHSREGRNPEKNKVAKAGTQRKTHADVS